ncbi:protein htrl [Plakobranchus ocellatus]|uniref:Protein htrl n=1 Tax=Plakobranchus ocellatus TaxID=259542 RepID=A0AAV4CK27_9GAST|nr:protein htrl [Plakobranchus ocellatus]
MEVLNTHERWCRRKVQGCDERFGPEKGDYSFTVVTALVDIGRGGWWTHARTYRQYLTYMLKLLKLDINLIVFIEQKGLEFVKMNRKGREHRTVIHLVKLEQLSYHPLLPKITEIMSSDEFKVA